LFEDYQLESVLTSRVAMGGTITDPMIAVIGHVMPYCVFVRRLMDCLNSQYHQKDEFTDRDRHPDRAAIWNLMKTLRREPDPKKALFDLVHDVEDRYTQLNTEMPSIMLSNVGPVRRAVGEPVKGAGFFGHTAGLHTVSIRLSNFRGRISFEGTLEPEPSESDWFPVAVGGTEVLEYPEAFSGTTTGTFGFVFHGNYVWLRATMDRTYFTQEDAPEDTMIQFGRVDAIKLL